MAAHGLPAFYPTSTCACSGDMVSGWVCVPSTERPLPVDCGPGWFERRWRQLIAPVHEARVPYAITLGNHE